MTNARRQRVCGGELGIASKFLPATYSKAGVGQETRHGKLQNSVTNKRKRTVYKRLSSPNEAPFLALPTSFPFTWKMTFPLFRM